MQAVQTASTGDLLSSKPLVPSFPSKPCWTDMQSLVMSQCDCNGCAPPEGKRACLALLLYGQRESVDEACQCWGWEVWCKREDDHTEALEWQQPLCYSMRSAPLIPSHLPCVWWHGPRAERHASINEAPVSQPPSRCLVPLPPPVSRSGAHFVCSAYRH